MIAPGIFASICAAGGALPFLVCCQAEDIPDGNRLAVFLRIEPTAIGLCFKPTDVDHREDGIIPFRGVEFSWSGKAFGDQPLPTRITPPGALRIAVVVGETGELQVGDRVFTDPVRVGDGACFFLFAR